RDLSRRGLVDKAADSPSSFLDDGPTSKLIRQILGAVSEFDKAMTVAKLKGARDRVRRQRGKCEGCKSHAERDPKLVDMARWLHHNADGRPYSLRRVAAELAGYGYVTPSGKPYQPLRSHPCCSEKRRSLNAAFSQAKRLRSCLSRFFLPVITPKMVSVLGG